MRNSLSEDIYKNIDVVFNPHKKIYQKDILISIISNL